MVESNVNPTLPALLARYSAARQELASIASVLKRRGIARTSNIIGELGERLALDVYGGSMPFTSFKSIDLVDRDGRRLQVKTRALPARTFRVYDFADLDLDAAVCIRFDVSTFHLDWAREIEKDELGALVAATAKGYRLTGARARSAGRDMSGSFREAWALLQQMEEPIEQH